jgi:hypothetical protein
MSFPAAPVMFSVKPKHAPYGKGGTFLASRIVYLADS